MAEYITSTDVQNRLTTAGYTFAADRDDDGQVTSTEESNYITTGIKYAGALVDEAVGEYMEPSTARSAGNQWLKDRCLDIAVVVALEVGGRDVPTALKDRAQFSLDRLESVKQRKMRVPGLTYASPGKTSLSIKKPRVYNVS